MLREFLKTHRPELIDRCRIRASARRAPRATPSELEFGIPLFLDQLTEMLPGGNADPDDGRSAPGGRSPAESEIEDAATRHGNELQRHDFTVDQVVHDYGDLCQSITELAAENDAPITAHEFGILNIRLDNAIAGAVTEYARQREVSARSARAGPGSDRLALLASEMRNLLNTSIVAVSAIKRGHVGFTGATAAALDRSLAGMRELIDRSLAGDRLEEGPAARREVIELGPFIADLQVAAVMEATIRRCDLTIAPVEAGVFVEGDRHILTSVVANLVGSACRLSLYEGHILLRAHASDSRVFIELESVGRGLPQEMADELFRPLGQSAHQTAFGSLLAIIRKGAEANGGALYARNIPGRGCVCIVELPRITRISPTY